jgi:Tfp pilus assembly protein PilO
MASTKATAWVAGSTVAALVVAAGAWFGVISPTLSNAADQRQAASDQRDHNVILQTQIGKLKAEYAQLGDYRARLAAIRSKMPADADMAEAVRELESAAQAAGVTITVLQPGSPSVFVPPASTQPAPAPSATASTDASATASAPKAQTASADGLYTIPLSVTTLGGYAQTVQFIDAVQQSMPRLFVLSQVEATSQKSSGASAGRPALSVGDLETTLTGVVLTLKATAGSTPSATPSPGATAAPTPTPTQLPVPGAQRNPFKPIGTP